MQFSIKFSKKKRKNSPARTNSRQWLPGNLEFFLVSPNDHFFMVDDSEYKFKGEVSQILLSEITLPVEYGGTLGHLLLLLRHASMSARSND